MENVWRRARPGETALPILSGVQDVQIETIRKADLAYPLNSIALACYAKLGGTPYVISAPRGVTQELVIGIGSAHVKGQQALRSPRKTARPSWR